MDAKPYESFEHTADIGVRVCGETLEGLFQNAAFAFADTLIGTEHIHPRESRLIEVAAGDLEELMVNWLSELLYLFEAEKWVSGQFQVRELSPERLCVEVCGEPYDEARHPVAADIKAVTYHQLAVVQDGDGRWEASVIFDV